MMAVTAVATDGRLPLVAASVMLVSMAVTGAAMVLTGAELGFGGCRYSDRYQRCENKYLIVFTSPCFGGK